MRLSSVFFARSRLLSKRSLRSRQTPNPSFKRTCLRQAA